MPRAVRNRDYTAWCKADRFPRVQKELGLALWRVVIGGYWRVRVGLKLQSE